MDQPRLVITRTVSWPVAQMVLEHMANAKEIPTFTIRRTDDGRAQFWFSKRTKEWLERVLAVDPRAHVEK